MIATRSRQNPSLPRSQILIISTPKHQSLICCGRYGALSAAYVRIRQHPSACVSIRQHTSVADTVLSRSCARATSYAAYATSYVAYAARWHCRYSALSHAARVHTGRGVSVGAQTTGRSKLNHLIAAHELNCMPV